VSPQINPTVQTIRVKKYCKTLEVMHKASGAYCFKFEEEEEKEKEERKKYDGSSVFIM
jgi:hypothetical protein